jgi:hypothetical protein
VELTKLDFDFETMARLAHDDPDGFARHREQLIRGLIAKSSRSDRLADLQLDIDAVRYGLPQGIMTAEKMVGMMMEATSSMMKQFERLDYFVESAGSRIEQ